MTRAVLALVAITGGVVWGAPGHPLAPRVAAQVTFEGIVADLGSRDGGTRLKAVRMLKGAAYPEAAVPLARAVLDPFDDIQLEAIGAELNIFLADKVTPRRRVGLLVEVRNQISAEPIFSAGPTAVGPLRVPAEVLTALATASRDPNARVAVEALYAFGALAGEVAAPDRPAMLSQSGPILAASIGATDPALRLAAIKVIGRVFARRPGDPPIEESVGDAVILALNDRESVIQQTAMWALGLLRYERAVQGLNELLQYHQRGPMATSAFDALARIGHPSTLTQLVTLLNGRDTALKVLAIEGLARMGDRSRLDTIQLALRDERNDAVLLAGHFANVRLAGGAADAIVGALSRTRLRVQALDYLFEIAHGRVSALARYLQDPDPRVRLDIVETLGLAGDPAALPIVAPLAQGKDPELARAAARAAARLRTDRAS